MRYDITTPPTALPFEWPILKAHRVLEDEDRELAMIYAAQATAHAEELLEMSLVTRTITATFYSGDELYLPRGPVSQVVSVTDATSATIDYLHERIGNRDYITIGADYVRPLVVVYTAGYAVDKVPADIVGTILVHAATLHAYREQFTPEGIRTVYKLDEYYKRRGHGQVVA